MNPIDLFQNIKNSQSSKLSTIKALTKFHNIIPYK